MDTLAESGLSKEQARWVNQMDQSAQLLLTIINDILDLSRIESGNFELYNTEMQLDESINLVASQLHDQAVKKNIALSVNISPSVPKKMVGDKNRISQVMFNLIGNAIKFTNQGSVSIDVKRDNQYVSIAVTDTGIGISQEAQRNLFNPFIQADGSITRRYGGTGLGLAISQHLIDKMNGKITLESTLHKGSCFTVYIPITQALDESQLYEPVIENSLDHSLSILLAEDSNTNQLVAKLMLEKRGHQVVIANNGKEALDILENNQHQFDIVLMDISMPVLDGLQATKQLRQKNINIPIIALTANAMHSDQIEYRKAGMDGFLAKPILTPELNAMLNKYQALATTE
jgi:CheY-like chemotaxis protein